MDRAFVFSRALINLVLGSNWSFLRMLNRFCRERNLLHRQLLCKRLARCGFLGVLFGS
jgi:hypothetical protein